MARPTRPFPRRTLEQSLRVPRALKDNNGGNPWESPQVAKALGLGERSGSFFYVTAASQLYGLSTGTRDTKEIALTDLGREVVYPQSAQQERDGLTRAFLHVELFRGLLDHFGGSQLPEKQFLANTLETKFGLPPEWHDEFVDIYTKNCKFLGIGAGYSRGPGQGIEVGSATGIVSSGGDAKTVTVATPKDKPDAPVCFVIMPFREREDDDLYPDGFFTEVLKSLFTPAITEAGFQVKTAASALGSDMIQRTIVRDLLAADLVLCDLTAHNPNVLFELGMRMHADLPIALVKATGTPAIFDVDYMHRVADYNPNLWTSTIEADLPRLTAHIKGAWENRESGDTFMKLLGLPQVAA